MHKSQSQNQSNGPTTTQVNEDNPHGTNWSLVDENLGWADKVEHEAHFRSDEGYVAIYGRGSTGTNAAAAWVLWAN